MHAAAVTAAFVRGKRPWRHSSEHWCACFRLRGRLPPHWRVWAYLEVSAEP